LPVSSALDAVVALLDLEPIEVNIFRGQSPKEDRQRVFGGQVAAQALIAAGRTVGADRVVHSLHAYFIRPGDPTTPILYEIERIRDGGSFSTRRAIAIQHGRAIFALSASFQVTEEGLEHQLAMPGVPAPEDTPRLEEQLAPWSHLVGEWLDRPRPFDIRFVTPPPLARASGSREPVQRIWLRADGQLPDDPLLHACLFAYASDMTLLDTALIPHGLTWFDGAIFGASLDHAMWFHRAGRADDWFLYDTVSPTSQGGRGLAEGAMYDRSGRRLLTVIQEGLIRPIRTGA
jgi:acyl-CoA thioesterase-2